MGRRLFDMLGAALGAVVVVGLLQATGLTAATLNVPHTFSTGQTVPASWLNDNNAAIQAVVNALCGDNIQDGCINGADLAGGAVSTDKLADSPNGITTQKLNDGAVTDAKVSISAAISGSKLADQTVPSSKLAVNASQSAYAQVGVETGKFVGATGSEVTLCTLPQITTRGGRVEVVFAGMLYALATANATPTAVQFLIYRDTTPIWVLQTEIGSTSGNNYFPMWIPPFVDVTATAGPHTYSIRAMVAAGGYATLATEPANVGACYVTERA